MTGEDIYPALGMMRRSILLLKGFADQGAGQPVDALVRIKQTNTPLSDFVQREIRAVQLNRFIADAQAGESYSIFNLMALADHGHPDAPQALAGLNGRIYWKQAAQGDEGSQKIIELLRARGNTSVAQQLPQKTPAASAESDDSGA